ncbi:MAG: hypothetical protein JKY54_18300 [Flavobacteriales bacterium]|nr:hypothetical protein [Flavobacteriales bacterium]
MQKLLFIVAVVLLISCEKDKTLKAIPFDCTGVNATYEADIEPLILASCATGTGPGTGCHDAWILNYNGLRARVLSGDIQRVVYELKSMPPAPNFLGTPTLTDDEIAKIMCWIQQGAQNN